MQSPLNMTLPVVESNAAGAGNMAESNAAAYQ